jgi:hypothetical protein
LETLRLALRLDPTIYGLLHAQPLGIVYAAAIVVLAGVSESLGQSVVLFLNRVRPQRFCAGALDHDGQPRRRLLFVDADDLVGRQLADTDQQAWQAVIVVVGLAYAPQIFAFFELTPYLGNLIWGVLSLWSMIAIVVALHFGLGMATWQALLVSALGWIVMQALRRTVGRPILHLRTNLQRRAAGVPLTVKKNDVAGLRRHPVRDWYKQLETRRRSVRLSPVRKPRSSPNEPSNVHRVE